jgi:hypothetical protein
MNNNNLYSMVPLHIRRDIKKIRQYQNTKSIILNGELNKLLNSLNKFNNEYCKLINSVEKKLLEVHNVTNYSIENFDNVQNVQNGIINQITKLNNIFSAMNEYIDNLQYFVDQNQINPSVNEIQRVEEKKQIEDTASRMAMSYISNIMTNNLNNQPNTTELESSNNTLFTTRTLNNQNQNDNNHNINDDSDF